MADKETTPATPSHAYGQMAPRWALVNSLLGGTETMREAGSTLMPKHQEESDPSWERRLAGATLLNMTEITLDMLAGKPFSDPVQLVDDAPPQHQEWSEDVDLQGNSLDVFARRWFRDGLAKGLSHVLIDMPKRDEEDGTARTLADDKASNARPYLLHIPPESVIFMSGTLVNGREVLDHVRISESEVVRDGWGEATQERIRVLEPGLVQIWELKKGQRKEEWVKVDEWATDLDYIPLVTFYTSRQSLGVAKPPLLDLAYMNVRHWQLDADLNNIISVACFPMLAMSGVDQNEAGEGGLMRLGPNQILATRSEHGKFYYVEHTGAAIETGEKKLQHLEELMSSYGAQFLKEKPGDLKATVRALDSAEALSQLQAMTLVFKDALETALMVMSDWAGLGDGGPSVEMNVDFGLNDPDEAGWTAIENARKRREISREATINEMTRRGWLSDDYDQEADKELLEKESKELMDAMAKLDLDPTAPDDPTNPPKPKQKAPIDDENDA